MHRLKLFTDYHFVLAIIASCKNEEHLATARRAVESYAHAHKGNAAVDLFARDLEGCAAAKDRELLSEITTSLV